MEEIQIITDEDVIDDLNKKEKNHLKTKEKQKDLKNILINIIMILFLILFTGSLILYEEWYIFYS